VSHSLTHLAGLKISTEDFLTAVLETVAQPILVVDPDDVIRFANPAAIAALGYDKADELFGRHSHETIPQRHPDGAPPAHRSGRPDRRLHEGQRCYRHASARPRHPLGSRLPDRR
jgi:PAS domain S-box-containing protein